MPDYQYNREYLIANILMRFSHYVNNVPVFWHVEKYGDREIEVLLYGSWEEIG